MSVTQSWQQCRTAQFSARWDSSGTVITVDGELDYPGGDLTVEKHEGAGHPQTQRKAVIAQAPPQQSPTFVVAQDVLWEAFAAQPVNLQICTQAASMGPSQKVPYPATGTCSQPDPGVDVVLGGVGKGAVVVLEPGQEVCGSLDPRSGVHWGARRDPQPCCAVSRTR